MMNKETICCPLCNAKLRPIGGFLDCPNNHREWAGTKELWQELITAADRAERLLEIAERQNEILQDNFATLGYCIGKEVMDMSDEIKQLIKGE